MTKKVLTGLFLLTAVSLHAQLNRGGNPWSSDFETGLPLQADLILTPPDLEAVAEEDLFSPVPYRFAINLPVSISLNTLTEDSDTGYTISDNGSRIPDPESQIVNPGTWLTLPSGDRIWLLTIQTPGAKAITVYFDRFFIPSGGRLFLYNHDKSRILGAFTELNNSFSGLFSTALIPGDEVTLEYNQPAGSARAPDLHISEFAYAYRGVPELSDKTGFGSSGPCEVNVECPEGDQWQDHQKGVARVGVKKFGATYWCSGSLVNNVRQDQTPYFLSADHCGKGATPEDIGQWIFYFSYNSPTCENPPLEPGYRVLTGAVVKSAAGDVNVKGSDFLLLLLNQTIPDTFDVWFNGWSREDITSPSGVGIHHPMGDVKKISTYTTPLIDTNWSKQSDYTHWQVTWAGTPSGHGVTEGGSSGSPLFDHQGRIVGTLTGGESLCDSSLLDAPDYYGKFTYSWNMNGPDSTEQLSFWLDPDNTGVMLLNGIPLVIPEPEARLSGLTIYPNPASCILHLKSLLFENLAEKQIILLDSRGRSVASFIRTGEGSGHVSVDISSLPNGFYLVRVTSGDQTVTGRIIKL